MFLVPGSRLSTVPRISASIGGMRLEMVITLDGDASVSCTAAGLPDGLYFALHLIVICSPIRERSSVAVVPSADIFISRSSAVIAEKYPELRAISHTKARLLELHSSVPRRRDALIVCESSSLHGL